MSYLELIAAFEGIQQCYCRLSLRESGLRERTFAEQTATILMIEQKCGAIDQGPGDILSGS